MEARDDDDADDDDERADRRRGAAYVSGDSSYEDYDADSAESWEIAEGRDECGDSGSGGYGRSVVIGPQVGMQAVDSLPRSDTVTESDYKSALQNLRIVEAEIHRRKGPTTSKRGVVRRPKGEATMMASSVGGIRNLQLRELENVRAYFLGILSDWRKKKGNAPIRSALEVDSNSVRKAVAGALDRLRSLSPELADHLRNHVRPESFCWAYRALEPARLDWEVFLPENSPTTERSAPE